MDAGFVAGDGGVVVDGKDEGDAVTGVAVFVCGVVGCCLRWGSGSRPPFQIWICHILITFDVSRHWLWRRRGVSVWQRGESEAM